MNTDGHGLMRVFAIAAAMMIVQAAHSGGGTSGGPEYEVTAIIVGFDCPPIGLAAVNPSALNEAGDVAGYVTCPPGVTRAFRWTADTGLELIPMPPQTSQSRAFDIEGSKVVGWFDNSNELGRTGFLYDFETNEFTSLGTLPGGNFSEAMALEQGIVVGNWGNNVTGDPALEAFIYQDGVMIGLGDDLGTPNSTGGDIASGLVTGWMGQSIIFDGNAYIWNDGKVMELPPIPDGFTSIGKAITQEGHVTGEGGVVVDDGQTVVVRSFLWDRNQMTDLGTLPGTTFTRARDIDQQDRIVGASHNAGLIDLTAFIWVAGEMAALNDLISPDQNLTMDSALAINQAGQITASAHSDDLNATVGVLLTPINQSVPGDLDGDGQVGVSDLLILLSNWGPCDQCGKCPADLNGDGIVGAADLLILLVNWG